MYTNKDKDIFMQFVNDVAKVYDPRKWPHSVKMYM